MHQRVDPPEAAPGAAPLVTMASAASCLSGLVGFDQAWRMGDREVVAGVDAAYRLVTQAHTAALVMLGELDKRGLALDAGAPSTQAWLTASQRMRPQDAKRDLTLASLIRNAAGSTNQTDPDGDATDADDVGADGVEGAEVRAGLVAGDLSVDQAGCVATALGELPTDATVSTRVLAERLLVDEASLHGPAALTRLGHRILERVDPEAADRRLANCLDREEREARRLRAATRYCDGHGSVFYKLRVPIGEDAHIWPVLDTLAAPDPADEASGRDLRLPQQRLADAFVEAFRRVGLDGGLPSAGGDRPRALVTIGLQQLRDGLGHGQLVDTGDQLSPTAMRILCCDAQIIPAVLGGAGQVLDLGRARRTFDGPIRVAVIGRDGGCIHPGCTRPARWCDVHHVISWWAGGDTSLDTVSCCAGSIIGSTTSAPGRSGSPPTGSPSRYHPPGSTPRNDPDATNASTNEDPALAECPRYTLRLTGALSAWRPR